MTGLASRLILIAVGQTNMPMHNPPHPGEILLEDVIPALDITITEMARRLGFARETFSRILHGRAPVSPDLAVRLERAV